MNLENINGSDIWVMVTSIVTIASIVVKVTPTKWDDSIVSKFLQLIALNKK